MVNNYENLLVYVTVILFLFLYLNAVIIVTIIQFHIYHYYCFNIVERNWIVQC